MRLWPFGAENPGETRSGGEAEAARLTVVLEALSEPLMVVRATARTGEKRIVFANAAARDFFALSEGSPMLVAAVRRPAVLASI
jgi:hypothetical protein